MPSDDDKIKQCKIKQCPQCDGTGVRVGNPAGDGVIALGAQCPDCDGTGWRSVSR